MIEIELLQQIGLNKYEAEAYHTLLSQGPLTGYELGKRSPVPLSRSYEILERLTQKGLALVQPGDPPRYTATNPDIFLGRVRTNMVETLDALATALAALPLTDTTGEFWVVRGRQHILEQTRAMIAGAQQMLALHLPQGTEATSLQTFAQAQSHRLEQVHVTSTNTEEPQILLLLIDGREALAGTLAPSEQCQAVVSKNPALVALIDRYFNNLPLVGKENPTTSMKTVRPTENLDWIAWEERKQRRLWRVTGNHVA